MYSKFYYRVTCKINGYPDLFYLTEEEPIGVYQTTKEDVLRILRDKYNVYGTVEILDISFLGEGAC